LYLHTVSMATKQKQRGNDAERYIVTTANEKGVESQRAWGSDGRSMGLSAADDGLIGWYRWQCKRFMYKYVPKWFFTNVIDYLSGDIDIVTIYVDKAKGHPRTVYVVQEYESWLNLKRMATLYGKPDDRDDRRSPKG
jgi:hypothetical protein